MPSCIYCRYWDKAKKFGKPDDMGRQWRKCIVKGNRKINAESTICKYFNPADTFYCDAYDCRLAIANCLNRRFNPKGFNKTWEFCPNCRQFEQDIWPIVNDYIYEKKKLVKPKNDPLRKKRILKRRAGKPRIIHDPNKKKKRVIKRRSEPKKVRKIKRRSKPKVRKIKRRKK